MNNTVGLKQLREDTEKYIQEVQKGKSFFVFRRSRPIFKISPPDEDSESMWEPLIDFTKLKKGGVAVKDLLSRL